MMHEYAKQTCALSFVVLAPALAAPAFAEGLAVAAFAAAFAPALALTALKLVAASWAGALERGNEEAT